MFSYNLIVGPFLKVYLIDEVSHAFQSIASTTVFETLEEPRSRKILLATTTPSKANR